MSHVYTDLVAAGVVLDCHQSDLYVLETPKALEIIKAHVAKGNLPNMGSRFMSKGERWIDLPFQNLPWWESRLKRP